MRPAPSKPTLWNILIDDGQASLAAGMLAVMWTTLLFRLLDTQGPDLGQLVSAVLTLSIPCIVWIIWRLRILKRRWQHDQRMRATRPDFIRGGQILSDPYPPAGPASPSAEPADDPPER